MGKPNFLSCALKTHIRKTETLFAKPEGFYFQIDLSVVGAPGVGEWILPER